MKAVDKINLVAGEGGRQEVVGLVGESGCGKTTTGFSVIRLISKPGRIVGGKVLLRGRDLLSLTDAEMRNMRGGQISMIFQDPTAYLNPVMKIGDQVVESILLHQDVSKREAQAKAIEALELTRIPSPEELFSYYPFQLSGGMKQRVVIATALSCNPSLLIADEPTSNLDTTVQAQIMNLFKKLMKEISLSVLLITHDLGIVAGICDRVYIMYAGKIVEHGDVYALFDRPKHPYVDGLLRCVLSIDEFREELIEIKGAVPDLINPPTGCRFYPRCSNRMKRCHQETPPPFEVERGHYVSCWLYK